LFSLIFLSVPAFAASANSAAKVMRVTVKKILLQKMTPAGETDRVLRGSANYGISTNGTKYMTYTMRVGSTMLRKAELVDCIRRVHTPPFMAGLLIFRFVAHGHKWKRGGERQLREKACGHGESPHIVQGGRD